MLGSFICWLLINEHLRCLHNSPFTITHSMCVHVACANCCWRLCMCRLAIGECYHNEMFLFNNCKHSDLFLFCFPLRLLLLLLAFWLSVPLSLSLSMPFVMENYIARTARTTRCFRIMYWMCARSIQKPHHTDWCVTVHFYMIKRRT